MYIILDTDEDYSFVVESEPDIEVAYFACITKIV